MSASPTAPLLDVINLCGLRIGSPQVLGPIRLVPILRDDVRGDLRLALRRYDEGLGVVGLDKKAPGDGLSYVSYVPHGLVVQWTDDGSPLPVCGGRLGKKLKSLRGDIVKNDIRFLHRMAKREDKNQLRMLPLHMAMEGFLGHYFNGPDIAWQEYSAMALSDGLSPRVEEAVSGRSLFCLDEALRVFEINDCQVGVLLFIADALSSVFIVSHPDDYRALHKSLIDDFFAEYFIYYSQLFGDQGLTVAAQRRDVTSLADLADILTTLRRDWARMHETMADDLLGRTIHARRRYRTGPFLLQDFMTDLSKREGNFIGEAISNAEGGIEYLKVFRITRQQRSRALILAALDANNWNIDQAAAQYSETREDFVLRLEKYGFGYLLRAHVLEAAHRMAYKRRQ